MRATIAAVSILLAVPRSVANTALPINRTRNVLLARFFDQAAFHPDASGVADRLLTGCLRVAGSFRHRTLRPYPNTRLLPPRGFAIANHAANRKDASAVVNFNQTLQIDTM